MTSTESGGGAGKTLLCIGFGYSAAVLAKALLAEGWQVIGTTRKAERAREIEALGATPLLLEEGLDDPRLQAALAEATHLLSSVAPDAQSDPVLREIGPRIEVSRNLAWLGYLSTTGVYGDHGGDWVDEETPTDPGNARSQRRVGAETGWERLCLDRGLPVHIFRLSGIYGPGRSQIDAVKAGRARRIVKPGQVFSRIHVEDIARGLRASMAAPNPGRIYNFADDEPAPADEVVAYAAKLLGVEPPPEIPFSEAELSEMAREFYSECRRVQNLRLRRELGVDLAYPTYREGLAAQVEATEPA